MSTFNKKETNKERKKERKKEGKRMKEFFFINLMAGISQLHYKLNSSNIIFRVSDYRMLGNYL